MQQLMKDSFQRSRAMTPSAITGNMHSQWPNTPLPFIFKLCSDFRHCKAYAERAPRRFTWIHSICHWCVAKIVPGWLSTVCEFHSEYYARPHMNTYRNIDHKLAETTWVHKIFGGQLRSRVTCGQCGYNSDTFDSILDLSLDINNAVSVKDGLKRFTAVDTLRGTNKYKCEK